MKPQTKETVGRSWLVHTHEVLALQAISRQRQDGLLAFSALPDAPVLPEPGPSRVRRMLRWSAQHIGQPVQRAEESSTPRERPSLTAPRPAITRSAGSRA